MDSFSTISAFGEAVRSSPVMADGKDSSMVCLIFEKSITLFASSCPSTFSKLPVSLKTLHESFPEVS